MTKDVCFPVNNFLVATVIITIVTLTVIVYIIKIKPISFPKIQQLGDNKLLKTFVDTIKETASKFVPESRSNVFPEKKYVNSRSFERESTQIGFIFNNASRYPLYEQVLDRKYYYHIIDDTNSRTPIKIPVTTRNYNQIFDGETITISEISPDPFTVKIYDTIGNRYNPDMF
jgi:hypothetical protein